MSTTNLFVELVVIGLGVAGWVAMLVIAAFGSSWIAMIETHWVIVALPALAVVYVCGIVWDRFADSVFDKLWAVDLRAEYYVDIGAYYNARRTILTKSDSLSDLLEYGRSRLRICRGWALNAIAITISLNILIWTRYADMASTGLLSIVGTLLGVAIAWGCQRAWKSLSHAEYRKIKEQSHFLNEAAVGSAREET